MKKTIRMTLFFLVILGLGIFACVMIDNTNFVGVWGIFAAFILAFWLPILFILLPRRIRADNLNRAPFYKAPAKVLAKSSNVTGRYTVTTYQVSFELRDGERISLQVDQPTYNILVEGEEGELRFKATDRFSQFCGFTRD